MTTMNLASLSEISPILVLSTASVVLMLLIAFVRSHALTLIVSVVSVLAALFASLNYTAGQSVEVSPLLLVSGTTHFWWILVLLSAFVSVVISHRYVADLKSFREEWYLLLMVAFAGALVLIAANHFAALFIGLELMSVPLYGLAAYSLGNRNSLESGLKYLVLSATASAFILFGIALIYAEAGSLGYASIATKANPMSPWIFAGCALILVGIGFKLSWAPFHLWTPDVYQGAPMPVTAFLATGSKVAVVAAFAKLMVVLPAWRSPGFVAVLALIAAMSIIVGNLLAMNQGSMKRLLAYSSVAHFGYLIIAIIAIPGSGAQAVWVYLATYLISSLAAFAVLTALGSLHSDAEADSIESLRGLFQRNRLLASILALSLLSMAGIPLTAGFIGKFAVFATGVESAQLLLLLIAVIGSAIGIYYYLRVAVALFQPTFQRNEADKKQISALDAAMIVTLGIATVVVGVWPNVILN